MATHRPSSDLYGLPAEERLRFATGIELLYALGPRVVASFVLETSADPIPELIRRLEDFARLSPAVAVAFQAQDWTRPIGAAIRRRRAA
jgi:hypothetical protein